MNIFFKILGALPVMSIVLGPTLAATASAAEEIVLNTDRSQIIVLDKAPATLVLGNPTVADVTLNGKTLYLHPRGYGVTNLILLDDDGKKTGDYVLRVIFEDAYSISLYSPGGRQTYSCRKDCAPSLQVGDNPGFFSQYIGQVGAKNGFAAGQSFGDNMRPPQQPPEKQENQGQATPSP